MDAHSRRRRAQAYVLVTGDRRTALETQNLDSADWATALRARLRDGAPPPMRRWPGSSESYPDALRGDVWIEQAFLELSAEQRACIAIPALLDDGVAGLADCLGWSHLVAEQRQTLAWAALRRHLADADADRALTHGSAPGDAGLLPAVTVFAERCLDDSEDAAPTAHARSPLRRRPILVLLGIIAGLALIVSAITAPQRAMGDGDGAIELESGRLRRVGRGAALQAAWSPEGSRIVVAATTGLYALDAATLRPLAYARQAAPPALLGFSPDSLQVASWVLDELTLSDALTLRPVFTAASPAWRNASAVAWDWSNGALAFARADGLNVAWPGKNQNERAWPAITRVTGLSFSGDGQWLAVTTAEPDAFALEIRTGARLAMSNPGQVPYGLAFSPDSARLIGVHTYGADVVALASRRVIAQTSRAQLLGMAWPSADNLRITVIERASVARILTLDEATGVVLRSLILPGDGFVGGAAVRNDGARALVIDAEGLSAWDLDTGQLLAASADFAPPLPAPFPFPLAFGPEGRWLAAPAPNGGIRLIDMTTGRLVRQLGDSGERFVEIAVGSNGRSIAANNNPGLAYLPPARGQPAQVGSAAVYAFDTESGRITHVFPGARLPEFVSPTVMLYQSSDGAEIRQFDFAEGSNRAVAAVLSARPDAFAALPGSGRIAALSNQALELWSPAAGKLWSAALSRRGTDRRLIGSPMAVSADAQLIAVAEPGVGIRVFGADAGGLRAILARPITVTYDASNENPLKVAISPDGRWIATIDNRATPQAIPSSTLTVWRSDNMRPIQSRVFFPDRVTGIAFSPDSRRLALIRADYVIELIDLP